MARERPHLEVKLCPYPPTSPPLSSLVRILDAVLLAAAKATNGARSRDVMTSVTTFHVLDCPGTGPLPPIVLLHGITACAADFDPLIQRLSRSCRRVIAIDMPGHGRTPLPTSVGAGSAAGVAAAAAAASHAAAIVAAVSAVDGAGGAARVAFASDAAAAAAAEGAALSEALLKGVSECLQVLLGSESFFLFGNSLGGFVAIKAANRLPASQVLGVMLASPGGAPLTPAELCGLKALFNLDSHARSVAFVDRVLSRRARGPYRHALAWAVRCRAARPAVAALLGAAEGADLLTAAEMRRVAAPILLLWGRQERIFDAEKLRWFRRHLPPASIVVQPDNCGHVPHIDIPDETAHILVNFMSLCSSVATAVSGSAAEASTVAVAGRAAAAAAGTRTLAFSGGGAAFRC